MERKQGTPWYSGTAVSPKRDAYTRRTFRPRQSDPASLCRRQRAHDNKQKLCVYLILSKRIFNESSAAFAHDTSTHTRAHVCVCARQRQGQRKAISRYFFQFSLQGGKSPLKRIAQISPTHSHTHTTHTYTYALIRSFTHAHTHGQCAISLIECAEEWRHRGEGTGAHNFIKGPNDATRQAQKQNVLTHTNTHRNTHRRARRAARRNKNMHAGSSDADSEIRLRPNARRMKKRKQRTLLLWVLLRCVVAVVDSAASAAAFVCCCCCSAKRSSCAPLSRVMGGAGGHGYDTCRHDRARQTDRQTDG